MRLDISARTLEIPFKAAFRHASAERARMQSLWVEATRGGHRGVGEGCPREYVTGEDLRGAVDFVNGNARGWAQSLGDLEALRDHVAANAAAIDAHPAAWCAVELALLDLFAREAGATVEALLGVAPRTGPFRYTAVLGDALPEAFAAQVARYRQVGFDTFKVKLSGDAAGDAAKVEALRAAGIDPARVRADANNFYRDAGAAIASLRALDFPFAALEEPLPAGDYAGMARVAASLGTRIVLDESLLRVEQLAALPGPASTWIANVRVSKMGGVLRSMRLADAARERGLAIIVGAHVGETSVLTRAALVVACAAGDALWAQEGAFGTHLLANDVADPPLMFGARGVLDDARLALPGWGLRLSRWSW